MGRADWTVDRAVTLYGWDASDYDWPRGAMDLGAAKRDGIVFFTHKATEGTTTKHKHFGEAVTRARDAGIEFIGAYHVVRSPRNARDEFNYFLAYVASQAVWLLTYPGFFVQVDLEKWPYDPVPAAEAEDFADIATAELGRTAIIYASRGQYGNDLAGTSHPLWNAAYGTNPVGPYRSTYPGDRATGWTAYSGVVPAIWQYGSRLTIGTQPGCDANAYRSSLEDLRTLIQGDTGMVAVDPLHYAAHPAFASVVRAIVEGATEEGWIDKTGVTWDDDAAAVNLTTILTGIRALANQAAGPAVLTEDDRQAIIAGVVASLPAPATAAEVAAEIIRQLAP